MSDFIAEIYATDKFGYHLFHHITVEGSQLKQQTLSNHLLGAETWSQVGAVQLQTRWNIIIPVKYGVQHHHHHHCQNVGKTEDIYYLSKHAKNRFFSRNCWRLQVSQSEPILKEL